MRIAPAVVLAVVGLLANGCSSNDAVAGITAPSTESTPFRDPQGEYSLDIGSTWDENTGQIGADVETWMVAPAEDGFAPNVNALTQQTPTGMDTADYLEASIEGMGTFEVLDSDLLGNDLGLIEYRGNLGDLAGNKPLHFLAIFSAADGRAVVLTFTSTEERFNELRSTIEPFLRTLKLL